MPAKKRKQKVWVWLTWQQVEALLAVAQAVEGTPAVVNAALPYVGDRAAFHGAIAELREVQDAMETKG